MSAIIDKREWEDTEENRKRATELMRKIVVGKIEVTRLHYDEKEEVATIDVSIQPIKAAAFIDVNITLDNSLLKKS